VDGCQLCVTKGKGKAALALADAGSAGAAVLSQLLLESAAVPVPSALHLGLTAALAPVPPPAPVPDPGHGFGYSSGDYLLGSAGRLSLGRVGGGGELAGIGGDAVSRLLLDWHSSVTRMEAAASDRVQAFPAPRCGAGLWKHGVRACCNQ
jgi:hypothetical protein